MKKKFEMYLLELYVELEQVMDKTLQMELAAKHMAMLKLY